MTELQARKAQQAYKELQVMWVPQVHKVLPEMMGQQARKGQQVLKELQVMLEQQVL